MAIEYIRPTANTTASYTGSGGSASITNPANAYNVNGNPPDISSYAIFIVSPGDFSNGTDTDKTASMDFYTFGTKVNTWTSWYAKVNINWSCYDYGAYTGCTFTLQYSTNSGTSWVNFSSVPSGLSGTGMAGSGTTYTSASISGNPTISSIMIRLKILSPVGNGTFSGDLVTTYLYDAWIEGTYTGTSDNHGKKSATASS